MTHAIAVALAASLSCVLAGCEAIGSHDIAAEVAQPGESSGVHYALAKGLVPFELGVRPDTGQFIVEALDSVFVKDEKHEYFLEYQPYVGAVDSIEIKVGPNQFIRSIRADVDDKTDAAIVEIARAVGAARGRLGAESGQTDADIARISALGAYFVDFGSAEDVARAERAMNDRVISYINQALRLCERKQAAERGPACERFAYLATDFDTLFAGRFIRLDVTTPAENYSAEPPDCSRGVCVRMSEPYAFSIRVGEGSEGAAVVLLPNRAPIGVIDISRAMFVQKITELTFDEYGFLAQANIQKQSELLEAAKLPLQIIKAVLSTPFEVTRITEGNGSAEDLKTAPDQTALAPKQADGDADATYTSSSEYTDKYVTRVVIARARNHDMLGDLFPPAAGARGDVALDGMESAAAAGAPLDVLAQVRAETRAETLSEVNARLVAQLVGAAPVAPGDAPIRTGDTPPPATKAGDPKPGDVISDF